MLPIRTISVRRSLDVIKDETGGAVLVTDQCITEPESLSGEICSCFQKVVNQLKLTVIPNTPGQYTDIPANELPQDRSARLTLLTGGLTLSALAV